MKLLSKDPLGIKYRDMNFVDSNNLPIEIQLRVRELIKDYIRHGCIDEKSINEFPVRKRPRTACQFASILM